MVVLLVKVFMRKNTYNYGYSKSLIPAPGEDIKQTNRLSA